MNKIIRNGQNFILTISSGAEFECRIIHENSTGKDHVEIPKEAREICGRRFVVLSKFNNSDIYEFEDKTEHRSGIGKGGWKSRLTEEEKAQIEEAEALIERIKSEAMKRELTEEEKLERQIAKLTAELNRMRK